MPYAQGTGEAATLLAAQLESLARFRHVIEAQRAVVRMGDAGLLESFSREADGLVADISSREVRLLAIRAAAQPQPDRPALPWIADLHSRIDRERASVLAAAQDLARDIEHEAAGVSRALRQASSELDQLIGGYARRTETQHTPLLDRTA